MANTNILIIVVIVIILGVVLVLFSKKIFGYDILSKIKGGESYVTYDKQTKTVHIPPSELSYMSTIIPKKIKTSEPIIDKTDDPTDPNRTAANLEGVKQAEKLAIHSVAKFRSMKANNIFNMRRRSKY